MRLSVVCILIPFTNWAGILDPSQNYSNFHRYQLRLKQGILAAAERLLYQNMLLGPVQNHIHGILKNVLKSHLVQRAPSWSSVTTSACSAPHKRWTLAQSTNQYNQCKLLARLQRICTFFSTPFTWDLNAFTACTHLCIDYTHVAPTPPHNIIAIILCWYSSLYTKFHLFSFL